MDQNSSEHAELEQAFVAAFKTNDYGAQGEILSGMIDQKIQISDVMAEILGELDWTSADGWNQQFEVPPECLNNKAYYMENGMSIPIAKIVKRKVTVAPEVVATPAYEFDTQDFKSGAIATAGDISDWAAQSLLIEKAKRGYWLLTDGIEGASTGLYTVEDDGTFTLDGTTPAFYPKLQQKFKEVIWEMQDEVGGDPPIKAFARSITVQECKDAGVSGVDIYPIPAAQDEAGYAIFTKGDIVLVAPKAAFLAKMNDTESSEDTRHWVVSFTFRWSHKWIKWSYTGQKRIRRIIVTPVSTKEQGTILAVQDFDSRGMTLVASKAIDKSSIGVTTIKVTTGDADASHAGGASYTATLLGDLRHIQLTFASALTVGTTYNVHSTTGLCDAGYYGTAAVTGHYWAAAGISGFVA